MKRIRCFVCKTSRIRLGSFRGFKAPIDDAKRQRWSRSCGVNLPVHVTLCDKHFSKTDYITPPNTDKKRAKLMPNALPKPVNNEKNKVQKATNSGNICNNKSGASLKDTNLNEHLIDLSTKQGKKDTNLNEHLIDLSTKQERVKNIAFVKSEILKYQYITSSDKSVQTDVRDQRICGYIEVSIGIKGYRMSCFYCNVSFSICSGAKFVAHLKEAHKEEEANLRKKFVDIKEKEILLQPNKNPNLVIGFTSNTSQEENKEINNEKQISTEIKTEKGVMDNNKDKKTTEISKNIKNTKQNCTIVKKSGIMIIGKQGIKTEGDDDDDSHKLSKLSDLVSSSHEQNESKIEQKKLKVKIRDKKRLHGQKAKTHKGLRSKEPRYCSLCDLSFTSPCRYRKHMTVHQPPRFKCQICSKEFRWKLSFEDHIKLHTNQRDLVCELCGASYARLARLLDHKKVAHSNERNFGCNICGRAFKTTTQLSCHRRAHHLVLEGTIEELTKKTTAGRLRKYQKLKDPVTNLESMKCDLCDKTFYAPNTLYHHKRKVHGITQKKRKNKCHLCNKTFALDTKFSNHLREQHGINSNQEKLPISPQSRENNTNSVEVVCEQLAPEKINIIAKIEYDDFIEYDSLEERQWNRDFV